VLDGEPSWLAAVEPSEAIARWKRPPLAFGGAPWGRALHVDLGDSPRPPEIASRGEVAVLLDGRLSDRSLAAAAVGDAREPETDAEFVLRAYVAAGERVLPLLRGSYALVVWDGRRGSALVVRDPNDSHPVFVARDSDRILVAASYGALFERGGVSRELDRLALAHWLLIRSVLPRRTFHERVERLPPGHVLAVTPTATTVRRYWHPRNAAPRPLPPAAAAERLAQLVDGAVERAAGGGRLGVFLSGGVDSATVATAAREVSERLALPPPLALSCVFPTPETNEERTQRGVAAALGLPQRVVPLGEALGGDGLLAAGLRLSASGWAPCLNPWEPAYTRLAADAAAEGCRVVLTGEGGNDWFEPARAEAADLLRRLRIVALSRFVREEARGRASAARTARALVWQHGARPLLRDSARRGLRAVGSGALERRRVEHARALVAPTWALPDRDLASALVDVLAADDPTLGSNGSYRDASRQRALDGAHLLGPVENRFLLARRIGVELANPPLDPDVVAFLYRLPGTTVAAGGPKGLARETVRARAGEGAASLLGTARAGPFFANAVRSEGPRALERLGGVARLAALGLVDERVFRRALAGPDLGSSLLYSHAWQVLACEAWLAGRQDNEGGTFP
jgi:hypothetical protein